MFEDWRLYSVAAMLAFTANGLGYRRLADAGVSAPIMLGIMFWIGTLVFPVWLITSGAATPPASAFPWLLLMGFIAWIGNVLQVHAIKDAPNPGYASAVIWCQTPLVALLAAPLFGDPLTAIKLAGTLVSVVGVVLLSIGESSNTAARHWVASALMAMGLLSINTLTYRGLSRAGVALDWINFMLFLGGAVWNTVHAVRVRAPLPWGARWKGPAVWGWLTVFTVSSFIGSSLNVRAIALAPNPGYTVAILAVGAVLQAVIAWRFFNLDLAPRRVAGACLCVGAVLLIALF